MSPTAVVRLQSMSIAVLLMALLSSLPAGVASAQPTDAGAVTTVYLQHIGDSGKPILPLLISSAPAPAGQSERVLGDVEALEATVVTVSELDLGKIVGSTKMLIGTTDEEPAAFPFGTFRVTVVEPEEESSAILAPEKLTPLLDQLDEIADGYEDLAGWVSSVKHRLALEEGS